MSPLSRGKAAFPAYCRQAFLYRIREELAVIRPGTDSQAKDSLAFISLPSAASFRKGFTAVFKLHEWDHQKSHLMWVKGQVVDGPK